MLGMQKTARKPRIVIVDDSRTVQAMLEQIFLNRLGCEIVGIANSAEEALPMIRAARPDIVTIDIRMPGRDGLALLEDLREEGAVRKIVIASDINEDLPLLTLVNQIGADAAFDKRVFTGRPGFFCVKMREIIADLHNGIQRNIGPGKQDSACALESSPARYPVQTQEADRLRFLSEAGLANADPDPVLDGITRYLGGVAGFPICLLTIIDSDVQWVKSAYGAEAQWTARSEAFCTYTICDDAMLAVPNATADARFAHNPLVTCTPGVRAYFGVPVASPSGIRLGALCLVDLKPRKLSQAIETNLHSMAAIVSPLISERWSARAAA